MHETRLPRQEKKEPVELEQEVIDSRHSTESTPLPSTGTLPLTFLALSGFKYEVRVFHKRTEIRNKTLFFAS
jgi:hypothetical protein